MTKNEDLKAIEMTGKDSPTDGDAERERGENELSQ